MKNSLNIWNLIFKWAIFCWWGIKYIFLTLWIFFSISWVVSKIKIWNWFYYFIKVLDVSWKKYNSKYFQVFSSFLVAILLCLPLKLDISIFTILYDGCGFSFLPAIDLSLSIKIQYWFWFSRKYFGFDCSGNIFSVVKTFVLMLFCLSILLDYIICWNFV